MSRIAKYPVAVPDKVQVTLDKGSLTVKGPLGTLSQPIDRQVVVKVENNQVTFAAADETKAANAMSEPCVPRRNMGASEDGSRN